MWMTIQMCRFVVINTGCIYIKTQMYLERLYGLSLYSILTLSYPVINSKDL